MGSSVLQTTRMTRIEISTSIMDTKTWRTIHSTILRQPGIRYAKECYDKRNYQYVQHSVTVIQELRWLQL